MSSNPPQNTAGANTPWGTTTSHRLGVRTAWRGRDKQWHFPEQKPDETVRMVIRKHKWFLVRPALPLIASSAALFLLLAWAGPSFPSLQSIWSILEIIAGILVVGTLVYFLYKDFIVWFYETTIITNKRVINWGARGGSFLNPSRQETPLDKVTQVAVDQDDPWQIMLNYGTVHIYITGGEVILRNVPRPKLVKDALRGVHEEFQTGKPPKEPIPLPNDPVMVALLEKLSQPEELVKLPDADEKYTSRHPEKYRDRLRGPRRTFGGPLRIPCGVHYFFDEYTVEYIQRSPYILVRRLLLLAVLLVITIIIGFLVSSLFVIMGLLTLVWLIAGGLTTIDYVDDVYILTTQRIIDIQRKYIFIFEDRLEVEYKNIRDIEVNVSNPLEYLLNIGDVHVQTPGSSPDVLFDGVSHPFALQDKIYFLKEFKEKNDKKKAKNERKEELLQWFGNVTSVLEKKATYKGVPDLQMLDFYTAAERARAFGMKVVFMGEDASHPNLKPGVVVEQNPLPGTLLAKDVEDASGKKKVLEIHVILSRR